ncbi:MAG: N-acetylmuramidase family protein [Muribaculaceae bacterium]|nr:N-acetylmuramidase family protein [Muribaculaceae bacterium]
MKKLLLISLAFAFIATDCNARRRTHHRPPEPTQVIPSVQDSTKIDDAIAAAEAESVPAGEILRLTEDDYKEVAEMLGVEPAAVKAVVEIEAGPSHQGFSEPGMPLINFDFSMFTQFCRRNGVNLSKYRKSHPLVFNAPSSRKYGSRQKAQHARLRAARTIDERTAIEGTFWGMFQIGGFNWRKCGASSINDFVERMSRSERDQLELFAQFLKTTKLDKQLKAKNWAAFARGYNGPSYARRGYHTRMARAYAKYSKTK